MYKLGQIEKQERTALQQCEDMFPPAHFAEKCFVVLCPFLFPYSKHCSARPCASTGQATCRDVERPHGFSYCSAGMPQPCPTGRITLSTTSAPYGKAERGHERARVSFGRHKERPEGHGAGRHGAEGRADTKEAKEQGRSLEGHKH